MSDEKKIDPEDLSKALSTLQDLAKGHSSRGTNTTEVTSMGGEGGSSQVHHTASNSDPGGWAGSQGRDCPENGATDAIDENGTDYNGGAEMVKSVLDKLAKGHTLSASEYELVKGAMPAFLKKDDDKDDKDDDKDVKKAKDDDDDDVKKSLADEAAANETVAGGMEISEFLAEFVGTINKSLSNMEKRYEQRIERLETNLRSAHAESESFNKSFAGAFGTISEAIVATSQRVDQVEQTPARGPKSQQVETVEKSFGGPAGEQLSKAVIAATMTDMVEKGNLGVQDVIRFESSNGQISEELLARVTAHRSGK